MKNKILLKNEIEIGIDVENPFLYYNTRNLCDIPKHLRNYALKYKDEK